MEAASHPEVNQLDATRLSGEVRTILKGRVAEGTKYNYICANTHSLLWLYNQGEPIRSTLIAPWFVEMLNTKASLDASARKKREEMKKVCREKLGEVSSDLGNCPILLPNLTFEIFTNFLVSKKRSNYHTNRGEDESTVAERQGVGGMSPVCTFPRRHMKQRGVHLYIYTKRVDMNSKEISPNVSQISWEV